MKNVFYRSILLVVFCFITAPLLAGFTISSPSSSSSITACENYILYFTASGSFSSYVVVDVYRDNSSGPIVKSYSNVSSGYISVNYNNLLSSTGLTPGSYQIKIYDYYNPSFYGWSDVFTISAPIPPPTDLRQLDYWSSTTFEIAWTSPVHATEFRLDVATDNAFTSIVPGYSDYHATGGDSGGMYITASGVPTGTEYYVRIRSYSSCGTSANSETLHITCPKPNIPVASSATGIKSTQFVANWSAASGATSYDVVITRVGHGSTSYSTSSTSYTTFAYPESNYTYKVKAKRCGTSGDSNVISLTTPKLGTPSMGSASGSNHDFRFWWYISWTNVEGASGFQYQVSQTEDFASHFDGSTENTHDEFEAVLCNSYYVRVRATCCGSSYSNWSAPKYLPGGACLIAGDESIDEHSSVVDQEPFAFFPNPSENVLEINFPETFNIQNLAVQAVNSKGEIVTIPFQIIKTRATFDVSTVLPGMYIVTLSDGKTKHKAKFSRK